MSNSAKGLVQEITDIIIRIANVNPLFASTIAVAIVALVILPYVVVTTAKGEIILNVFGIIIGGSGVGNKTRALDIARNIVDKFGHAVSFDYLLPEKFTTEALTKLLTEFQKEQERVGIIVGDELSRMFTDLKKDWFAGVIEFLSKLYDGRVMESLTIKRGKEGGVRAYVCFLSGTTFVLIGMITESMFVQGTVGRILWTIDSHLDEEVEDPFRKRPLTIDAEIAVIVDRLLELHFLVSNLGTEGAYVLELDEGAKALLGQYYVDTQRKARRAFNEDPLNPSVGTVARLAENATKLAAIHCFGRCKGTPPIMDVVDVQWAIEKVELHFLEYLKLQSLIERTTPRRVSRATLEREHKEAWIKDQTLKLGHVKTSEFAENFNIKDDAARKYFNRLVDEGKMTKEVLGHNSVIWRWRL